MTLIDAEPTPTPTDGRHRWPIVTVAAAAVVILGVGALILSARDESDPPGSADTIVNMTVAPDAAVAAEKTARGFLDAYVANDADRALSYVTQDAIAAVWGSAEGLRRTLAWDAAAGYKRTVNGCERSDGGTAPDVTLRCSYDLYALRTDAIGLDPYPAAWDLTVRDGQIVASTDDESPGGLYEEVWKPFYTWVRNEHPDDVAVMYQDSSENLHTQLMTDEALRLWEQHTGEYVQAVLTGPDTYAADVASICATQAAQLGALTVPAEGALDQVATWNTAAAEILRQTRGELTRLVPPPRMDETVYSDFHGALILVVRHFDATAEAATAGDSTRLNDMAVEYQNSREGLTSGPAGSGLEKCLDSIPTSAMSGMQAP